jgi:hypothetical protein
MIGLVLSGGKIGQKVLVILLGRAGPLQIRSDLARGNNGLRHDSTLLIRYGPSHGCELDLGMYEPRSQKREKNREDRERESER